MAEAAQSHNCNAQPDGLPEAKSRQRSDCLQLVDGPIDVERLRHLETHGQLAEVHHAENNGGCDHPAAGV